MYKLLPLAILGSLLFSVPAVAQNLSTIQKPNLEIVNSHNWFERDTEVAFTEPAVLLSPLLTLMILTVVSFIYSSWPSRGH